jgi:hypothetical protein
VAELAAEFGEFTLELVGGDIEVGVASGGQVVEDACEVEDGELDVVAVVGLHGLIPFRLGGHCCPPG